MIYDVPAASREGGHPVYKLCPRPWKPEDLNPLQQVQDLVLAKFEMNFFFKLAAAWNADPGEWRLFPDFLQLVYSRRVITADADRGEESAPEPAETVTFPRIAA